MGIALSHFQMPAELAKRTVPVYSDSFKNSFGTAFLFRVIPTAPYKAAS